MKDLKYIHLFESLLNETNNELVKKAVDENNIALGYSCFFAPEVLLNIGNAFGVRMRAPNTGSVQLGTYYLSNFTCGMSRALVERGLEGGFNFLGGICATETCSQMNRAMEHFKLINLVDNDKFFMNFIDVPMHVTEHAVEYYAKQIKEKLLKPMSENHGIDISDEAIVKAVNEKNELNAIMREISSLRKRPDVIITGTEMHVLNLVAKTCPVKSVIPLMRETLEELKNREPDLENEYRARIVVVGSEIDDHKFTELMEQNGALVVADRYCFGTLPGYEKIELTDKDPVISIARHYLNESLCPRFMSQEKKSQRRDLIKQLCEEYNAEGVLFQSLKFCDYWGYERVISSDIVTNEYDIPSVCLELNYTLRASGQLKTRIQAFVENLEIKRISRGA